MAPVISPTLAKIMLGMFLMLLIAVMGRFVYQEWLRRRDRFKFNSGQRYYLLLGKNLDGRVKLKRKDGVKVILHVPKGCGQNHISEPHALYEFDELGTPMVMVRNAPREKGLITVEPDGVPGRIYLDAGGHAHVVRQGQKPKLGMSEWQVRPIHYNPVDGLGRHPSEFRPYSAEWNERMASSEQWKTTMDGAGNQRFRIDRRMVILMGIALICIFLMGYLANASGA